MSQFTWSKKEISKGLVSCDMVRDSVLAFFHNRLNNYHEQDHSISYYDLKIGYWLEHICQLVYMCEQEGGECSNEIYEHVSLAPMKTIADLSLACTKSEFRNAIKRIIYLAKFAQLVKLTCTDTNSVSLKLGRRKRSWTDSLGLPTADKLLVSSCSLKCSNLEKLLLQKQWNSWARFHDLNFSFRTHCCIDWNWRLEQLGELNSYDSSLFYLTCVVALFFLPIEILEAQPSIDQFCSKLNLVQPKYILSSSGLHSESLSRHLIAKWREDGSELWYIQHGGGYGIEKDLVIEAYEIRVSDKFFTWGWEGDCKKIHSLPPAYSMKDSLMLDCNLLSVTLSVRMRSSNL